MKITFRSTNMVDKKFKMFLKNKFPDVFSEGLGTQR